MTHSHHLTSVLLACALTWGISLSALPAQAKGNVTTVPAVVSDNSDSAIQTTALVVDMHTLRDQLYEENYKICLNNCTDSEKKNAKDMAEDWTMKQIPLELSFSRDGGAWSEPFEVQDSSVCIPDQPLGKHTYDVRYTYSTGLKTYYAYTTYKDVIVSPNSSWIHVDKNDGEQWQWNKTIIFELTPELLASHPSLIKEYSATIDTISYHINENGTIEVKCDFQEPRDLDIDFHSEGTTLDSPPDLRVTIPKFYIEPSTSRFIIDCAIKTKKL